MFSALGACQISNTTPGERLHFFAGLDRTFAGCATELHKFLREDVRIPPDLRSKLGDITYPLAKNTPGIQAADLLVHLMYLHSINQAKQGQLETPRILRQLSKRAKQNQKFTLFNAEAIQEMENFARERYASIFSRISHANSLLSQLYFCTFLAHLENSKDSGIVCFPPGRCASRRFLWGRGKL